MIRTGSYRLFVLGSAALAAGLFTTCGGIETSNTCGKLTCTSGALLHIPLGSNAASLVGATATACRNGECYVWPLPSLPATGSDGITAILPGATSVFGTFWLNADKSITLDVEWRMDDASQVQDGDRYVVTLTDAAGTPTTLLDKTAAYQTLAPNGDACAPVCSYADLVP